MGEFEASSSALRLVFNDSPSLQRAMLEEVAGIQNEPTFIGNCVREGMYSMHLAVPYHALIRQNGNVMGMSDQMACSKKLARTDHIGA